MLKPRLLAALVDYCVILGWLVVLAAIFVPLYLAGLQPSPADTDIIAFVASVLPIWLYLTVTEAGAAAATWGKRVAGLRVLDRLGRRAHPARIALRNAVKLLPWQLAHLAVAAMVFTDDAVTLISSSIAWLPLTASYVLVGLSVALVLIRDDRAAVHDLIAGTRVALTEPQLAGT